MVVAPGAADVVGALEHREVRKPVAQEPDRRAEAGEAGADDRDIDLAALSVHDTFSAASRKASSRPTAERIVSIWAKSSPWNDGSSAARPAQM